MHQFPCDVSHAARSRRWATLAVARGLPAHHPPSSLPQLLGELSFLLGTIPAVSVEVTETLKVIEAKQSSLLELLNKEPEVAGNVFRLLGVVIGERIQNTSASIKSSLTGGGGAVANSSNKAGACAAQSIAGRPRA